MARTGAAVVALAAAGTLGGLAAPAAAAPSGPSVCNTGVVVNPMPFPAGTTFYGHNPVAPAPGENFTTVHASDASGDLTVELGGLPVGCTVNALAYKADDGYLYGMFAPAAPGDGEGYGDQPTTTELIRIGVDIYGSLVAEKAGDLTVQAPANQLVTFINEMDRAGTIYAQAGYFNLVNPLDPLNGTAYVQRFDTAGAALGSVQQAWDASCLPMLRNFGAQLVNYAMDPTLPHPEGLYQDWAYNPVDDKIYAYAAVDAREEYLAEPPVVVPWTQLGGPMLTTVQRQPDWVVQIDPVTGVSVCATVNNAVAPPGFDRGILGPIFGDAGSVGNIWGAQVGGMGFTADGTAILFENEHDTRWTFDVTSCTFPGGAPQPCSALPVQAAVPLPNPRDPDNADPGIRVRADAASFTVQNPTSSTPVLLTVREIAIGSASTFPFTVTSPANPGIDLGLEHSQLRTYAGLTAGAFTITQSAVAGWPLASITCTGAADVVTVGAVTTVTIAPGGAADCTFINTAAVPGAEPAALPATGVPTWPLALGGALLLLAGLATRLTGRVAQTTEPRGGPARGAAMARHPALTRFSL